MTSATGTTDENTLLVEGRARDVDESIVFSCEIVRLFR